MSGSWSRLRPRRTRAAVDLHNVLTGYALSSWTEGDGRSLGGVSAIVQDLSGYLWLGTNIGLVRFDGWRFTRWETISRTPLPRSPIVVVVRGSRWRVVDWVCRRRRATNQGRRGARAARCATETADPCNLSEDHNGTIWTVTNGTVRRFRGGRWEKVVVERGVSGADRCHGACHRTLTSGSGPSMACTSGLRKVTRSKKYSIWGHWTWRRMPVSVSG